MCLLCGMGAMPCKSPDASYLGLHPKPINAAIRRLLALSLLAPYVITLAATKVPCKTRMMKNTPILLAILMAMAICQYNTTHISQSWRSRASLEDTGCCHQASICSNSINWSCQHCFFRVCMINLLKKGSR
jgi:hypothetical protein